MRLLVLTPDPPAPPTKGTALRNYYLIAGLATQHTVRVLTYSPLAGGVAGALPAGVTVRTVLAPSRSLGRRLRVLLASTRPDLADRRFSPAFVQALREECDRFGPDLLMVEGLEMAPAVFALGAEGLRRSILDAHNAEYRLQAQAFRLALAERRPLAAVYAGLQALKLARFEGECLRRMRAAIAVSTEDAAALERLAGRQPLRLAVVPNGIDCTRWRPAELPPAEPPVVLFTGTMDYRPNVDAVDWFARAIWPRVRRVVPEARFVIVGRAPAPAVQALAHLPGITVTGAVPDDRPHFARAAVYVVPVRFGGGVRFKVLQALACGLPVVSTRAGASGLVPSVREALVLADDPVAFAAEVVMLLRTPARRQRLAALGRERVVAAYDWSQIWPRLLTFVDEVGRCG